MSDVGVADQRGVEQELSRRSRGIHTDLHWIEVAPDEECLGTLLGWTEQLVEIWHRAVVQVGRRGPHAFGWICLVGGQRRRRFLRLWVEGLIAVRGDAFLFAQIQFVHGLVEDTLLSRRE